MPTNHCRGTSLRTSSLCPISYSRCWISRKARVHVSCAGRVGVRCVGRGLEGALEGRTSPGGRAGDRCTEAQGGPMWLVVRVQVGAKERERDPDRKEGGSREHYDPAWKMFGDLEWIVVPFDGSFFASDRVDALGAGRASARCRCGCGGTWWAAYSHTQALVSILHQQSKSACPND